MALIAIWGTKSDFGKKFTVAMEIIDSERRKGLLESVDYIDVSLPEQPVLSYLNLEPTEPWPVY